MTQSAISKEARELAKMYRLVTNGVRVDYDYKQQMYQLAGEYPEIHYLALQINNKRFRGR